MPVLLVEVSREQEAAAGVEATRVVVVLAVETSVGRLLRRRTTPPSVSRMRKVGPPWQSGRH
jgi:hypothetical protein